MITSLMLALAALTASADPATPKVYAVIVANNRAFEAPELSPLRYADDDGARYFELFELTGGQVTLLSVLDPDTQVTHVDAAARARAPNSRELDEALDHTFEAIERDRAAGTPTAFYFVFVGHGSVQADGQGAVHLLDARFTRADLFHRVLARSPATTNHVVIDACNAYFMVQKRGADPHLDRAVFDFLDQESLARYPNTGVLVSTSQATEVHEWARFSAGIFSHELRSGMAGAADVDGDGNVTYQELRGFIAAANAAVRDPRARLAAFVEPPALHQAEPFFGRRLTPAAPQLRIPATAAGRYWLEDARGVRYADLHGDEALTLTLVPSPTYFLRDDATEFRIPIATAATAIVTDYPRLPYALASRGSEALTFQRDLFSVPFGRKYLQGFAGSLLPRATDTPQLVAVDAPLGARQVAAFSLAGTAVGALALGITFGVLADQRADAHFTAIGTVAEVDEIRNSSEGYATTANVMYAVSGALALGALGLWLWPSD